MAKRLLSIELSDAGTEYYIYTGGDQEGGATLDSVIGVEPCISNDRVADAVASFLDTFEESLLAEDGYGG